MAFLRAFVFGWARALRGWQAVAALYLTVTLVALAATALPGISLLRFARYPAVREAADGIDTWMVLEQLIASTRPSQGATGGFTLTIGVILLFALPVIAWLLQAFLLGGLIEILANPALAKNSFGINPSMGESLNSPADFHHGSAWRNFWLGSRRWFAPFLLLGLMQPLSALLLLIVTLVSFTAASAFLPSTALWVFALLPILAFLTLQAYFEMSRVQVVRRGSLGAGLANTPRWLFSRPLVWLGYYLLSMALWVGVAGLFNLGVFPVLPLDIWPLVFLVMEVYVLLRILLLAARYAGLTKLLDS